MKAILVVDIDDDVKNYGVTVYHYPSRRFIYSMDANLKPLPEKNTWDVTENGHVTEFAEGWNACLEEIEE